MSATKERITQVMLTRRYNTSSYAMETCWIRADLAKRGKRVCTDDGLVWTVEQVYGTKSVDDLEGQYSAWREFATKLEKK